MRIAALYIYENSLPHIFGMDHQAVTLNLGGRSFYKVNEVNGATEIVEQELNPAHIEGFWPEDVSLVSAIVGANGTGKTTVLELIKNGCQLVIEEGSESNLISTIDSGLFFYFTPYLSESRANEERPNVHNISKLSQMSNDSKYERMDFSGHWEYHNSERLKRIISFIEQDVFRNALSNLGITQFDKINIKFSNIKKDDWNTSRNFRSFFDEFKRLKELERVREEQKVIEKLNLESAKDIKESEEYNSFSDQLRLRLSITESVIYKVHSILELTGNRYLEEGFIENNINASDKEFKKISNTKTAFYWFIDRAYLELRKQKFYLPVDQIKTFLDLLLSFVEADSAIRNGTTLKVSFEDCNKIISSYQKFLISFREVFTYDETVFISFSPDKSLSTGEMSFYELFSSLDHINYRIRHQLDSNHKSKVQEWDNYIFLLDESDLGFHPFWKRKYIKYLTELLPEIFPDRIIQIIFTTHDALTLSDIPNSNIVYLKKSDGVVQSLNINNPERPKQSFAANITDLLADSFFLENSLMGDFAKDKINQVINFLNYCILKNEVNKLEELDKNNGDDHLSELLTLKLADLIKMRHLEDELTKKYCLSLINIIDEPLLKYKLKEMFYEAFPDEINQELAKKQIEDIAKRSGLDINFGEA